MQTQYKTPMMQQWHACKMAAPNALLLFRLGDFYEAFEEDAQQIASLLGLFLTKRQEIPMCGIPAHAADNYLEKLVGLGYRVAIAEQTEEAKSSQGLVKREIVKILSPATHINSTAIAEKEPLLFASVSHVGKTFGLSIIDLTTGLFQSAECSQPEELFEELKRLHPTELITSDKTHSTFQKAFTELQQTTRVTLHKAPPFLFELGSATSALKAHFEVTTLDAFGFEGAIASIQSSGALLRYLKEDHRLSLSGIFPPQLYRPRDFLYLDASTMQNLELLKTRSGDKKGSLLHLIDSTKTPMGARLLAEFLRRPSLDIPTIVKRQEVGYFIKEKPGFLPPLQTTLSGVRDFERIAMKLSQESPAPRDLGALLHTLTALPPLFNHLSEYALPALLYDACQECSTFEQEKALLDRFLSDTLPLRISEGGVVRSGFSPKLDELRFIAHSGKEWLLAYQERLRVETGIKTLKVGYTNAFGYYIEISKAAAVNAPSSFERRQTLAQAERFITPELKEFEYKVLRAEGEALALEKQLFFEIHAQIKAALPFMIKTARALAQIDALTSLGALSLNFGFSCPQFTDVDLLEINEGRHPVVEAFFAPGNFTPNSCKLDQNSTRLILLTGPNMAGKSTYIRQIALLVILAQIGAFVPAESMRLSLIDQLFTRIGASDDLARGHSTFMVEMTETAHILHHATDRSLVILDEIGRGTSTFDGIAIAWSVAEYLLSTAGRRPKTLFATHYFELTALEKRADCVKNYHVAVAETASGIRFLHRVAPGPANKSYGIHVAKLAGLPAEVIERACEIQASLETTGHPSLDTPTLPQKKRPPPRVPTPHQFLLFPMETF